MTVELSKYAPNEEQEEQQKRGGLGALRPLPYLTNKWWPSRRKCRRNRRADREQAPPAGAANASYRWKPSGTSACLPRWRPSDYTGQRDGSSREST